jgi:hypothetical protein
MKRFVLITVVPVLVAFGAGIAIGSGLTSTSDTSSRASVWGISPEAIQRGIDARTLPATEVRDFN